MSHLEITNAVKSFGGLKAVNDVSFDVRKGEIVGLLGPNGSGKTTMINMISGALPMSSGHISLNGVALSGRRADQISRLGVARTFQLVKILPSLSLSENVRITAAFGKHGHWGQDADRIAQDALAQVGLSGKLHAMAGELTYIDQKRLELARALAADPDVLLLDEWLAGLNPTELLEGIALIRELTAKGITILMVEHIMKAVRALCPRVVVMNSGSLIADDETEKVLSDPEVVKAYLGEFIDA